MAGIGFGLLMVTSTASAFGLGELVVKSSLGAPFRAMVAIRGEIAGRERIDAQCFRLVEGEPADDIPVFMQGTLRFQQSSGETYLIIEGKRPLNEPAVQINLLVGCGAELKRTYTALIDPRPDGLGDGVVGHAAQRAGTSSQAKFEAQALSDSALIWVTADGDSAASIARSRYPRAGLQRKQFLQALREANPEVGFGGNGKKPLPEGVTLNIPDAEQVARTEFVAPSAPAALPIAPDTAERPVQAKRLPAESAKSNPGGRLADHLVLSGPRLGSELDGFDEFPLRLSYDVSTGLSDKISENARAVLRSEYRLLAALNDQASHQLDVAAQVRNLEERFAELRAAVDETSRKIDAASASVSTPPEVAPVAKKAPPPSGAVAVAQDWLPIWLEIALVGCLIGITVWAFSRFARRRVGGAEVSTPGDVADAIIDERTFEGLLAGRSPSAKNSLETSATPAEDPHTQQLRPHGAGPKAPQSTEGARMSVTDPVKEVIEVSHVQEAEDSESAIELASVLMAFGRAKGAVQVLTEYLESHPDASLLPWLKLLEIVRASDMQEEFAYWSDQLKAHFNVAPMSWEEAGECFAKDFSPLAEGDLPIDEITARLPIASTLEHVREGIVSSWHSAHGLDYLRKLLRDTRDGQRLGLPLPLAREVAFLVDLLEARLEQQVQVEAAPAAAVLRLAENAAV